MKHSVSYSIEVYVTPEESQTNTSPFFWCILKYENGYSSNEGSGWAKDPLTAYLTAYHYYESILCPSV